MWWNGERSSYSKFLRVTNLRTFIIADETGLFFRLALNKTLSLKGDPCNGGKNSKERITVL
jgi:hypothetical protein